MPVQNLGLLAQIGIPIASLGSQSSGTSTTEKQASPLEQVMGWSSVFKNFFPGGF
jgi:hypothetical protein